MTTDTKQTAWRSFEDPPAEGSWSLCYCRIPQVVRNGRVTRTERYRYLVLEYAEGTFWVNRGAPEGFVLLWQSIDPPTNFIEPTIRGRRVHRQQQALPVAA